MRKIDKFGPFRQADRLSPGNSAFARPQKQKGPGFPEPFKNQKF